MNQFFDCTQAIPPPIGVDESHLKSKYNPINANMS